MTEQERFRVAVEAVLKHEGGYVADPDDPGGATNWGISQRSYPDLDIRNLDRADAVDIYWRDWWVKFEYGRINNPVVATKMLDLAVNVGPTNAHKMLQRSLHACGSRHLAVDGLIGPKTLAAVNQTDGSLLLVALRAEAAAYYRALVERNRSLAKYEDGWLNRAYA